MAGRELIVIGGSAGSLDPLQLLLRGLPVDLAASVCIVLHTSPESQGHLTGLLARQCRLPVRQATDGEEIERGQVYVAAPDQHLLVKDGNLRVTRGPRENGFRPAVDPLFRTAAKSYGAQLIGVLLSGALDDGTHGLKVIQHKGGATVVQSPQDAQVPSMPQNAINHLEIDHVVPAAGMAEVLMRLVAEPVAAAPPHSNGNSPDIAEFESGGFQLDRISRPPSKFTCPECGGALWEFDEEDLQRFRCHVGHGYTAQGLLYGQSDALEAALWSALRALEENGTLYRRMAARARRGHTPEMATRCQKNADDAETRAAVIRQVLFGNEQEPALPGD